MLVTDVPEQENPGCHVARAKGNYPSLTWSTPGELAVKAGFDLLFAGGRAKIPGPRVLTPGRFSSRKRKPLALLCLGFRLLLARHLVEVLFRFCLKRFFASRAAELHGATFVMDD